MRCTPPGCATSRLGKARIIAGRSMLTDHGPGDGAGFDLDREVYEGVSVPPGAAKDSGLDLEHIQFAIRYQEHLETAKELTRLILRTAGYSASTFGDHGDGGMETATGVHARDRRTTLTKGRKERHWVTGLQRLLTKALDVNRAQFGGVGSNGEQVSVSFPDGAQDSQVEIAQTVQLLHSAQAASRARRTRRWPTPTGTRTWWTRRRTKSCGSSASTPADPRHHRHRRTKAQQRLRACNRPTGRRVLSMPVSPDYAMELARSVREVYEKAEDRLIRTIAAQVAAGVQAESVARRESSSRSPDSCVKSISSRTSYSVAHRPLWRKAIGTAYRRGIAVGGADLDKAGFKGSFGGAGRTDAITRLLGETMDTLIDAPQRIRRVGARPFDRATTDATSQLLTGTITRQQAARDAVKRLASEGVKTFTDKSGRNWELASYAEMATRTSSGRAMIDGHTQTIARPRTGSRRRLRRAGRVRDLPTL